MKKTLLKIIVTLFVVTAVILAIFFIFLKKQSEILPQNKTAGWLTYGNEKFGYSVNYPNDWVFREFPDTQTGAGFRPLSSPEEISSECVTIDLRSAPTNYSDIPFVEYVRKAAVEEIQNYEKLNSMESVTTTSGIVGYKTTWLYRTMGGQEKISLPITYFENNKTVQMNYGLFKAKTVQIILNGENCEDTYNSMISSFRKY